MPRCPSCSTDNPASNRFCGNCSTPLSSPAPPLPPSMAETVAVSTPDSSPSPVSTVDEGRFVPGTVLGERYRIMSLLGRGGMGEVYRALDLKLGQQVALKFLPEAMARDPKALARFQNEVRIARQVSHPNVCRVYDIGELQGQPFLSMEYVDGEDLGSLLRRIGRLPEDKAVEMARKLCAGLAAAHDKGVLHRDLKPSNVMIDARGELLITDFGLAALAGEIRGPDIRSGTPQYMAPEQLEGREVSSRSDVYSLGLVLYEMFAGKRAFDATSLDELRKMQAQSSPASLSRVVRDMDPAVERVILRCLQVDPKNRPATPLSVAAALPGGDPLAAALAAGETPSPDLVAASGEHEGLRPGVALGCLVAALLGTVLAVVAGGKLGLLGRVPFEKPAIVLASEARDLLKAVGYTGRPTDSASGFRYSTEYLRHLESGEKSPKRWAGLASGRPAAVRFWYRESPRYLEPDSFFARSIGTVTLSDPGFEVTGMVKVGLDPQGHLLWLNVIPPQFENPPGKPVPMNWSTLFAAAGLEEARFQSAEPQWTPGSVCDVRSAWTGSDPSDPKTLLRVEAAAWRGKPVYFQVIYPWTRPDRQIQFEFSKAERASQIITLILLLSALVGACIVARRNLRLGRGDRRGAFQLAGFVFSLGLLEWLLTASHVPTFGELRSLVLAVSWYLLMSGCVWLIYLALEPAVRRRWPETLVSWSRIMAGHYNDPLVGRDLLYGMVFGIGLTFLWCLGQYAGAQYGLVPAMPRLDFISSPADFAGGVVDSLIKSAALSLLAFFLVAALRALLRSEWLAAAAFVSIFTTVALLRSPEFTPNLLVLPVGQLVFFIVLTRYGMVTMIAAGFVQDLLVRAPLSADLAAWYAMHGLAAAFVVAIIAIIGFKIALAGRPLFRRDFLDS